MIPTLHTNAVCYWLQRPETINMSNEELARALGLNWNGPGYPQGHQITASFFYGAHGDIAAIRITPDRVAVSHHYNNAHAAELKALGGALLDENGQACDVRDLVQGGGRYS